MLNEHLHDHLIVLNHVCDIRLTQLFNNPSTAVSHKLNRNFSMERKIQFSGTNQMSSIRNMVGINSQTRRSIGSCVWASGSIGMLLCMLLNQTPGVASFAISGIRGMTGPYCLPLLTSPRCSISRVFPTKASFEDDNEDSCNDVVVLGGGFGGLNAALTVASLLEEEDETIAQADGRRTRVRMVEPRERFVFLPLLYELCVGDATVDEVAPTYDSLFETSATSSSSTSGPPIERIPSRVVGIDAERRQVWLEDGSRLGYGALLVATGAGVQRSSVPGAKELALPFYTVEDAEVLRGRLSELQSNLSTNDSEGEPPVVIVVGGGYSGVELALNVAEFLGTESKKGRVALVHRGPILLEGSPEHNRESSMNRLKEAGVEIRTETSVDRLESVDGDDDNDNLRRVSVHTTTKKGDAEKSSIEERVALVLWTAGIGAEPGRGALNSPFDRDTSGRLVVDRSLRVPNYPGVYALGDGCRVIGPGPATPQNAQAAIQQAAVAASNAMVHLRSSSSPLSSSQPQKLLSFRYVDLGNMMSLGSDDATVYSLGGAVQLDGLLGSIFRRLVYAVRMPTPRQAARAAVLGTSWRLERTSKTVQTKVSSKMKRS